MKAAFLLALAVVAVAAAVLGDNMVEMWRQLGRTSSAGYDDCGRVGRGREPDDMTDDITEVTNTN